jgi:hypothetical protein
VDEKPIREIQPVVIPAAYYFWGPLRSGLLALPLGFLVEQVVLFLTETPNAEDPLLPGVYQWGLALGSGAAVAGFTFLAGMILFAINDLCGPGRTSYLIFPDRIEYCEELWTRSRGTLRLDQVSDMTLSEGLLQQTRGAGTIRLFTGKGEERQFLRELVDIPRPHEVYDLLRSLASQKARTGQAPPTAADSGVATSDPTPA